MNDDGSTNEMDWGRWMRGLGRNSRRIREFLGLSQEQLARMAGVSQGAISRLEAGRGLATPLLVVVRIHLAFRRIIDTMDPALMSDEVRRLFETDHRIDLSGTFPEFRDVPLLKDPQMEEYLRTFRDLPDRQRQTLLSVVRATASALQDDGRAEPVRETASK